MGRPAERDFAGSTNLPLGTKSYVQHPLYMVVSFQTRPPFSLYGVSKQEDSMYSQKHNEQGTITLSQIDYLPGGVHAYFRTLHTLLFQRILPRIVCYIGRDWLWKNCTVCSS
jgi:hypothetical protein